MKPEPIIQLCIMSAIIACLFQFDANGVKVVGSVVAVVISFFILKRISEIRASTNQTSTIDVNHVENTHNEYEAMLANSRNIQYMEALNIAKELLGADYIIQDYVEEYDDFFGFYYGHNNSEPYHPGLPEFSGWDGGRLAFFVSRHTGQIKHPPYPYKVQEGEMLLIHSSSEIEPGMEAKKLKERGPIKIWRVPISK